MKTIKTLIAAIALMTGFAAFAADYGWSSTSTKDQYWHTLSCWTNGAGVAATDLPTNAADRVTLPAISETTPATRSILLMNYTEGTAGSIASIVGGAYWKLAFNPRGDNYNHYTKSFTVADVNDFTGIWAWTGGKKTLRLTAASGTQTLPIVQIAGQCAIEVANAATTADILQLKGTVGSVKKSGAGDLRIRKIVEPGSHVLELEAGNVQIDGKPQTTTAAEAALLKSAVWLDASNRATWQNHTYVDDDGRTRVTNWLDAAGRSVKAEIWDNSGDTTDSHIKNIQPPFVAATTSTTGLTLIDFGAGSDSAASAEKYGPQSLMRFTQYFSNAKEIFYVADADAGGSVLGDDTSYYLSGDTGYAFRYYDPIVENGGFAYFNGYARTPDPSYSSFNRMTRPLDAYTTARTSLQLTDVVPGNATAQQVHYIAGERLYKSTSGGVRVGEVLIYTEVLTADERAAVTDYLMRKWFAKYSDNEFDVANVKDATSITVPEGRVAKIGTLRATGTTFTKKGAGILKIGRVYPEDLTITVEGGGVQLDTEVRADAPTTPVGTPYFWVDAESENAFTKDGDNVTAWNDRRDNGKKAARLDYAQITAYPQVDTTKLAGRTVLTFPSAAAFQMPSTGQRESFVVFCYNVNPVGNSHNILGEGYHTDRNASGVYYLFANPGCGEEKMAGGTFSVDGKPVRPFETTGTTLVKDQWQVAHFATTTELGLNRLASNGPRSVTGGISYGEVIVYDKVLTPEERTQTIEYLMQKWLGKHHPEYDAPAKDITLSFSGTDAAIGSDGDATFADVTGSGALTKTGTGDATVTAELTDDFTSLAVQGGSLTITKKEKPEDTSVFHYDAMDAASFTTADNASYFIDANGETNIQRIVDTRRNGNYAYMPGQWEVSSGSWIYMTNPIVRHVSFPDGKVRPIFDFLKQNGRNVNPPTGAGLYLSNVDEARSKVKEAHYIFGNGQSGLRVFHGRTYSCFLRGLNGRLFRCGSESGAVSTDIQNGYISVNNQIADSTYVLANKKFYLVSVAPLSAQDISTLGVDRADQPGGDRYGECIAFTEYLTAKERAWWQNHLMHKWIDFTLPEAVWTNDYASVTVASGATLSLASGAISAPTITGGGTIDATEVMGISTLNLTVPTQRSVEGLTIDGTADFAGAVTVNLAGGANLKPGTYTLVTATALENLDLANWTLAGAPAKYNCSLARNGNAVELVIQRRGVVLFVR